MSVPSDTLPAALPDADTALEAPVSRGEEFRDKLGTRDSRRSLGADELKRLTQLSAAHSLWALAQTFGLVVLTAVLGLCAFSLLRASAGPERLAGAALLVLAIVLMGCWQHGLAIISHESTHYRLFESRAANDWVGRVSGMLIGVSTFSYRIVHRLHHNHLYEEIDPDMALMAGYPGFHHDAARRAE